MEIPGRVHNGVVAFEGETTLPEGRAGSVVSPRVFTLRKPGKKKRVKFPLVQSQHPGTVRLTGEDIAKIMEDEELASFRKSLSLLQAWEKYDALLQDPRVVFTVEPAMGRETNHD